MGTLGPDTIWSNLQGSKKKAPHELIKGEETVWGQVRPAHERDGF